jgi:transcriptional regulator with XRE-family HTH domain
MKSEIDKYVSEVFRKKRLEKGLSQQELADLAGFSRSFINDIESIKTRNKLNVYHINLFSEIFDISPRVFLPEKAIPEK